jgi:hypothetical protein
MTKEKEYWSLEELIALTETVQEAEVEHQGKYINVQWCELVESEEPKFDVDETLSESEKNLMYMELGKDRCLRMLSKASKKNPEITPITKELWEQLPSTLKYKMQNTMMGVDVSDFHLG